MGCPIFIPTSYAKTTIMVLSASCGLASSVYPHRSFQVCLKFQYIMFFTGRFVGCVALSSQTVAACFLGLFRIHRWARLEKKAPHFIGSVYENGCNPNRLRIEASYKPFVEDHRLTVDGLAMFQAEIFRIKTILEALNGEVGQEQALFESCAAATP